MGIKSFSSENIPLKKNATQTNNQEQPFDRSINTPLVRKKALHPNSLQEETDSTEETSLSDNNSSKEKAEALAKKLEEAKCGPDDSILLTESFNIYQK